MIPALDIAEWKEKDIFITLNCLIASTVFSNLLLACFQRIWGCYNVMASSSSRYLLLVLASPWQFSIIVLHPAAFTETLGRQLFHETGWGEKMGPFLPRLVVLVRFQYVQKRSLAELEELLCLSEEESVGKEKTAGHAQSSSSYASETAFLTLPAIEMYQVTWFFYSP